MPIHLRLAMSFWFILPNAFNVSFRLEGSIWLRGPFVFCMALPRYSMGIHSYGRLYVQCVI
jgi:hypothetical protein